MIRSKKLFSLLPNFGFDETGTSLNAVDKPDQECCWQSILLLAKSANIRHYLLGKFWFIKPLMLQVITLAICEDGSSTKVEHAGKSLPFILRIMVNFTWREAFVFVCRTHTRFTLKAVFSNYNCLSSEPRSLRENRRPFRLEWVAFRGLNPPLSERISCILKCNIFTIILPITVVIKRQTNSTDSK